MDIYLDNLGRRQQVTLLQWRASSSVSQNYGWYSKTSGAPDRNMVPASGSSGTPRRLGWLGRFWAQGAQTSPEVAAAGLDSLHGPISGMVWGMNGGAFGFWVPGIMLAVSGSPVDGLFMLIPGVLMSGIGFCIPQYYLRRVCRPPVSEAEVSALQALMPDELERAFLRLVEDAMRQQVLPETAVRVRAALQAVAEAIDHLPTGTVPRAGVEGLLAEAEQAQAEAQEEQDAVIAASYRRKADALHRSALAAQRSQMLVRRAAALREELLAQIESLRLGLSGFDTAAGLGMASGDVNSLDSLADAVRTIAIESVSASDARAEVEGTLLQTSAETIQTLGRPQGGA